MIYKFRVLTLILPSGSAWNTFVFVFVLFCLSPPSDTALQLRDSLGTFHFKPDMPSNFHHSSYKPDVNSGQSVL